VIEWIPSPGKLELVGPKVQADPLLTGGGIETVGRRYIVMFSAPAEPKWLDEEIADPESCVRLKAAAEASLAKPAKTRRVQVHLYAAIREGWSDDRPVAPAQMKVGTSANTSTSGSTVTVVVPNGPERVTELTSSPLRFFKVSVLYR
jgi:hypothetical protein